MMRVESTAEIAGVLFLPIKNPLLEMRVILLWWKEGESFAFVQGVVSTLTWGTIAEYADLPLNTKTSLRMGIHPKKGGSSRVYLLNGSGLRKVKMNWRFV
jgi:hypothetical protein